MADRKSDDRGLSCSQSQQSVMDLLLHLHCKRIREISESESSLLGLENSGYPVSLTISFSVLGACLQTQSQCTLLFERVALQSVAEETPWPVRFPCSWGYTQISDLLLLLGNLQRGRHAFEDSMRFDDFDGFTLCPCLSYWPCTLRAQIVYDLLVPRGKNTPKTGQTGFATNREVKGFEDGTPTYFDSLRFHSILRDNPIIYDNPLSSTACAEALCFFSLVSRRKMLLFCLQALRFVKVRALESMSRLGSWHMRVALASQELHTSKETPVQVRFFKGSLSLSLSLLSLGPVIEVIYFPCDSSCFILFLLVFQMSFYLHIDLTFIFLYQAI